MGGSFHQTNLLLCPWFKKKNTYHLYIPKGVQKKIDAQINYGMYARHLIAVQGSNKE